jgi:hypothetical protein
MRDFEAYYAAGRLWNAHEDPYGPHIWEAEKQLTGVQKGRYEALPFVGPPALLPPLGLIARMPFEAANIVWRAILALCIFVIVIATLGQSGKPRTFAVCVLFIIAALGFGPLTSAFALGQAALPAFAFALLAVRWGAVAVLAWIQPNLALATAPLRAFIPCLIAFSAICVAIAGPPGIASYARVVRLHGAAESLSAIQLTPAAVAYGFGAGVTAAWLIGIIFTLAAVLLWAALLTKTQDVALRFYGTCALLPFAAPFFHEHDLLVLFPAAIVLSLRAEQRLWPLAAAGALLCGTDWLGLTQRPQGVAQTILLIAAFGAALAVLRRDCTARMLAVPAAACVCIALCGAVAAHYPLQVWPDGMHALPSNVANLPIDAAWHAELAATGLFTPAPMAAAMRLLSLCGCGIVAIAALRSSPQKRVLKSPVNATNASTSAYF